MDSTDSTYSVVSSSCFRTRIESVPYASRTAHHNMDIPVPCWCRIRQLQRNHHLPTSRSMSLLRSFRPGTCSVVLHSGPMLKSINIILRFCFGCLIKFTPLWPGFPKVLVNTYGLPRYQEANPALFTIVTCLDSSSIFCILQVGLLEPMFSELFKQSSMLGTLPKAFS